MKKGEKMKKIVLIIEDLSEEQARAKEVMVANGFRPAVTKNLADANRLWDKLSGKIAGVITDLHFPESEGLEKQTVGHPCGLAVVTRALLEQIPVSICSDIDHHFCKYLEEAVKNLEKLTGQEVSFTMDSKDWSLALKNLESQVKGDRI
jgi:hypothetical protein